MVISNLQFHIKEMGCMTLTSDKTLSQAVLNYPKLKQAKACNCMKNQIFKDEILWKKFIIQKMHYNQKKNF